MAVGAVSEDGRVYLNHHARAFLVQMEDYLDDERRHQLGEIAQRKKLFRVVRPQAPVAGRSVIVTDDGIATGATMIAALQGVKAQNPREVIVAVPVASPAQLEEVRGWCDDVVCLLSPEEFWAIGQFYADFSQVEDEQAIDMMRSFAPGSRAQYGSGEGVVTFSHRSHDKEYAMLAVRTILHPTDFSERSAFAFSLACTLARDYGARLVLVHVTPTVVVSGELVAIPRFPPDVWKSLQEQLANLRSPDPNVSVEHHLKEGDPATEILRLAQETKSAMIVMGTHGRTGFGRLLMGSVAEQVVRRAPCLVVTVKTPLSETSPTGEPTSEMAGSAAGHTKG